VLNFLEKYMELCEQCSLTDYILLYQVLLKDSLTPALDHLRRVPVSNTSEHLCSTIRYLKRFVWKLLANKRFYQTVFMMNDFLNFRPELLFDVLKSLLALNQKMLLVWIQTMDVSVKNCISFNFSLFEKGADSISLPSKGQAEVSNLNSMMNKAMFIFKREPLCSEVNDHQNALMYHNRDQTLISSFFKTLEVFLAKFDEIELQFVVLRLHWFLDELFFCLIKVVSTMRTFKKLDLSGLYTLFGFSIVWEEGEKPKDDLSQSLPYILQSVFQKVIDDHQLPVKVDSLQMNWKKQNKITEDSEWRGIKEVSFMRPMGQKVKELELIQLCFDHQTYHTAISERNTEFIENNFWLLFDSNIFINSDELETFIVNLAANFRKEKSHMRYLGFLRRLRESLEEDQEQEEKVPLLKVWRSYVYLNLLSHSFDINVQISKEFTSFVRKNFGLLQRFMKDRYSDRVEYLTATLTSVIPELSFSSHSSFTDALLSFITDDDGEEPSHPDKEGLEIVRRFHLQFIEEKHLCIVDTLLETTKCYSREDLLDHLRFAEELIYTINLNKKSMSLIVFLLEYTVEMLCRSSCVDLDFFGLSITAINRIFDLNVVHESSPDEALFKSRFQNMPNSQHTSRHISHYLLFKVYLRVAQTNPADLRLEKALEAIESFNTCGPQYYNLLLNLFEQNFKTLISLLSTATSTEAKFISSWTISLKILQHFQASSDWSRDRGDCTDPSGNKLKNILLDIINNLQHLQTRLPSEIIYVSSSQQATIHAVNSFFLTSSCWSHDTVLSTYLRVIKLLDKIDQSTALRCKPSLTQPTATSSLSSLCRPS
jgi:hypothetical protein